MPWRSYAITVLIGWIVLGAAGAVIASQRQFPWGAAAPVLAAFLIEYAFFVLPGFTRLCEAIVDRVPMMTYAGLLAASALLPYLAACLGGGFELQAFLRLAVIAGVISYWYVFRRPSLTSDLAVVALVGAILLTKVFRTIFNFPLDEREDILGSLMLYRLYFMVMLTIRELDGTGFTFLPSRIEWKIGFMHFVAFIPIGFGLASLIGFIRWEPSMKSISLAPLQFLGALWGIALFEEFLFRAVIQRRIEDFVRNRWVALAIASVIFGCAHVSFGSFPNWKFVTLAGVAGLFYGHAYLRGQGIGAAMVAHAFTVTLWRTLFKL